MSEKDFDRKRQRNVERTREGAIKRVSERKRERGHREREREDTEKERERTQRKSECV